MQAPRKRTKRKQAFELALAFRSGTMVQRRGAKKKTGYAD